MIFCLREVEEKLEYKFKSDDLLRQCFTHSSYVNEHFNEESNERLEFLGDSVLGLIVADYLFRFKTEDEGDMTADKQSLVSTKPLSEAIERLGVEDCLLRTSAIKITDKMRENLYESVVGGIYLDGGYESAKKFVYRTLILKSKTALPSAPAKDPKSALNEYLSKRKSGAARYEILEKRGRQECPEFKVQLLINGKIISTGKGGSRKEAEKAAADAALEILNNKKRKKECSILKE